MVYSVSLQSFHGPFDLLVHLIEKDEIDISDIPISQITKQYLEYLNKMIEFDFNITSEFILMASTLIEIKSKMLLPVVNEQSDPREDLVNQIIEYKLFKQAAEELKEKEKSQSFYLNKNKEEILIDEANKDGQLIFDKINAFDLLYIFTDLMKNNTIEIYNEKKIIRRENYNFEECVASLLNKVKTAKKLSLSKIINKRINKQYAVVVFLSILELSKMEKITIEQNKTFSDIKLIYKGDLVA